MTDQLALGFAGLLRQLRAEARLTQEELAEAAALSPRSVSDLERGINRTARKDTAELLAGALGLAEPARALFVAAARGRGPAVEVLAAMRGQGLDMSQGEAAGVHGFLPALTSFIGRAAAVCEVAGMLGECRLVTVTGPGGVGKTRLADAVAWQVADRFADGVWLAELAHVQDPAQVPAVVAAALGVRDQSGVPAAEALARVLARQQLLLVLDNCEHVIGATAELCAGLLPAVDDVRVLATSREPLRTAGEARYRLAPLTLPGSDDPAEAAGVGGCDAVALYADRARQADARFVLDDQTRPVVARLVRRLDGMPLAIELAAARVEALGAAQLLDRLDDRFALLASGDRLAAGRHQSLAATMEWSYQLLDKHEQRVFRALSVFPGPFTLQAAQAVAGKDAGRAVLHLVDCSLVVPPQTGPDSRARYGMLETPRAYAAGLLAGAGEQGTAAAALAGYALRVAEEAAAGLDTGTGEVAAALWLDAEDATNRQVLAWAMQHDAAIALRLAVAVAPWWQLRGRLAGQYPLLREVAGRADVGSDGWCTVQSWLGFALFFADPAGALSHLTAACDALGARPPSRALADCLSRRSVLLSNFGRIVEATGDSRRSLALARALGYPAGEAYALQTLSIAAWFASDVGTAVRLARHAGQIRADIPGLRARGISQVLTAVLIEAGDLAAAERVCATALASSRDAGDLHHQASLLMQGAVLNQCAGRIEATAEHLREGLQTAARIGSWGHVLIGLDCCAYLCTQTRRFAEAVTIWAVCTAAFQREGFTDWPTDARRRSESLRAARQALGCARSRAAEERGAAMNLETAAEYAQMLTATGPWHSPQLPGPERLSVRERELVTLVAQGRTDAQIAAQLCISVRTVRTHLDRIRDKTSCRRRADLTRLALQDGLV